MKEDDFKLLRGFDYGVMDIIFITSDPVDKFQNVRGYFGVVYQGQSNGEVTVHIS